ncbi:hypothetical protein G6F56_011674 [Rhizopus delemar]|nr:hypothetical protein G6F56_011674 [Rhizopus delemar]
MGDYVQFAIITLKHNRSILKENTPLLILHAASVPYSVIFSTLKRTPSLIISCNQLAFVTFDQTLIAISLDKESVFEERLALKEGNDILCTQLNPMNGSVVSTSAVTRKGIIEFQVDIDVLGEQEGNMYENINERDALVFKSRLEQAIFFGVSEDEVNYYRNHWN